MPRAGGVYSAPPGTAATPNTTVASSPYNALVADLVADANAARPVTAGGTGATNAYAAIDGLNVFGADMASAATLNLANSTGSIINVTGTVTISALGTMAAGVERTLIFGSSLTIVYNAVSLILPTVASSPNLVVSPGDVAVFRSKGAGNWVCTSFLRANGGLAKTSGQTIVQPTLTLAQSAAPTPTAEGDIQWDTDDDAIIVGDGAAGRIFLPIPAGAVAGDLLYLSAAKVLTRLAKGTAGQSLVMNPGATAPQWATVSFESAQQTITAGGTLTIAHGLGVKPTLISAALLCQTADSGFVAGNEVQIALNLQSNNNTTYTGISVYPDATNLNCRFGASNGTFDIIHGTAGTSIQITNANWKLILRARV